MVARLTPLVIIIAWIAVVFCDQVALADDPPTESPRFSRHLLATFSRVGCNGGTCHGAVKGQNGFRLSLFGADPLLDYEQIVRAEAGRRINRNEPTKSLLLLKAAGQVPHGGGRVVSKNSKEYQLLRDWIVAGTPLDDISKSQVESLTVTPTENTVPLGEEFSLRVHARFADGSEEDVTPFCSFESRAREVAAVSSMGQVRGVGIGDASVIVRFRAKPVMATVIVPQDQSKGVSVADAKPQNSIDESILAKLKRLNIPPSPLTDDATFLRRASLDVTGQLPSPQEVRDFLADVDPDKRRKKIDELLKRPGYSALWTLKFCDILKASDFGVYADGLKKEYDAPRFMAWIRARLRENTPYDELATRILTASSREGRRLEEWRDEVLTLHEGYTTPRTDLKLYSERNTLDLYWQRKSANGIKGTLQIAHAFLGLRLECAQCHRHPHDVWQQDDLLSFANFFMGVRTPGFQGQNAKKYPESAKLVEELSKRGKQLANDAKKLKESELKTLDAAAKKAKTELGKLNRQLNQSKTGTDDLKQKIATQQAIVDRYEELKKKIATMERMSKGLPEAGKRILHAEIFAKHDQAKFAKVSSPLGTQESKEFRLLGETESIKVPQGEDPRHHVAKWLTRPDNPYFAKAIVNRVWAHYFGRGLIDPPDNLSPFNPATHPELLEELCRQFIQNGYDLKWLHRKILNSRTYQQSSLASGANQMDRQNYAYFYFRRLPAEVLLDALNQATGTTENMQMQYWKWPEGLRTVEIPFRPRNEFVSFLLEQFGRPRRNSAVQCDCERDSNASILQVMSFANHPHILEKIADPSGRVAEVLKATSDENGRIEEVFLGTLSRFPTSAEREACVTYLHQAESPEKGLRGVMWSLINTREFLLQH